jgi:hypothetical protein
MVIFNSDRGYVVRRVCDVNTNGITERKRYYTAQAYEAFFLAIDLRDP